MIYGNPKSKQKGRIERWGLRLRPYDFTIVHKPGNDNIADYLSRNPVEQTATSKHEEMAESYLNLVSTAATPKAISRQELIEATLKDRRLVNAKRMIQGKRHLKDKRFSKIISELCNTRWTTHERKPPSHPKRIPKENGQNRAWRAPRHSQDQAPS